MGNTKNDTLYRTLLLWRVTLSHMSWWWFKSSGILHHWNRQNSQKRVTCLLLLDPEGRGIIVFHDNGKYSPVDMAQNLRCHTSNLFTFFPLLSQSGTIRNVTTKWPARRMVRRWEGLTNNTVSAYRLWKCAKDSTGVGSLRSAEGAYTLSNYYSGCSDNFKINYYSWTLSRW